MLAQTPLAFGRFAVDPARRQLRCDGKLVPLNGKALDLLLILISSDGAALSRDALYDRLWPQAIVEDANLSQTVYLLRRALDPDGDGRAYIETIPRFGYRFLKDVRVVLRPPAHSSRWASWRVAALAVLALALLAGRSTPPQATAPAREINALGDYHLSLRSPTDLSYALDYFKAAQHDAPRDATAFAGAAAAEALLAEFASDESPAQRRLIDLAKRYRDSALARDPDSSQAFAVTGFIAYRFENDRSAAELALDRAIADNPENAAAHHWRGVLLLTEGNVSGAIDEFADAHRLQPTSEVFTRWLARAYTYAHRPEDAVALATETLRIERTDAPAWLALACAQEQRGELREALHTLETLGSLDPYERRYVIPDEARIEVVLHHATTRTLSSEMDRLTAAGHADPFEAALFYLTVGQKQRARSLLHSEGTSPFLSSIERYDPRLTLLES